MIYKTPQLTEAGLKPIDFINYLENYNNYNRIHKSLINEEIIRIKRTGIDGHLYINENFDNIFTKFIENKRKI